MEGRGGRRVVQRVNPRAKVSELGVPREDNPPDIIKVVLSGLLAVGAISVVAKAGLHGDELLVELTLRMGRS